MIHKIFGPPGTGKTYKLISRAKAYVRIGTPLHKIGYFAFTRKAAAEARTRMPADDNKLPYFQTLHSFAYHRIGLKEEDIMQPYHYEELGKELGIKVKFMDKYNKEEIHYLTCDNPYFQIIQRAANRNTTVDEEFDLNEHDTRLQRNTLKDIERNLKNYKTKKRLLDFNDMIKKVISLDAEEFPSLDAIFIDEAQDLSPLQWMLYDKLKEYNPKTDIYLAGDDDQAIFGWAGADVRRFITEPAKEKILKYSKRISRAVQEESQIPIGQIVGLRKEKQYYPRNYQGESFHINNLDQIDLTKGKWLILTRTISRLMRMQDELKSRHLYFATKKGKSYRVALYKAATYYADWQIGKILEEKEINAVRDFTGITTWNVKKEWYTVFTQADEEEKNYISRMLEGGEKLSEEPRIWLSTIHSIKGGEEDNVILCLDMGDKILKAIKKSTDKADEEHKVWYVGTTRARNNLYKLKAKIKRKGYKL